MLSTGPISSGAMPRRPDPTRNLVRFQTAALCAVMLIAFTAATVRTGAQVLVSPGSATSVEGSQNNSWPFDGYFPMQYEQAYSAADFNSITAPEYLTSIAFRPDAAYGSPFTSTLPDIRISISSAVYPPFSMSANFADNIGADNTVVYSGALTLSSNFTGPVNGPKDFDITIPFTTPFLYTPGSNILMYVEDFGGGTACSFDAVYTYSPSKGQRVFDYPQVFPYQYSPTGEISATGLVTQFTFGTPPPPANPEPGSLGLIVGLISAAGMLLKRRQAR